MSQREHQPESPSDTRSQELSKLLTVLHEVNFKLANSSSVEDLCLRAVTLGREALGFERISVWFLDTLQSGWLRGTYGTDEVGRIRDERESRVKVDPHIMPAEFFQDKVPYLIFRDTAVFDDNHLEMGIADLAVAPIWNGRVSMGAVSADNLLDHTPMDESRCHVLALLARSIGHLATLKETEARLRDSQSRLEILASRDGLTGALNRRTGLEMLEQQLSHARRTSEDLSICFVDLDGLKWVNDTRGHQVGDRYIRLITGLFEEGLRESDIVCRMGGDEFMIILPLSDGEQASAVLERILLSALDSQALREIKDPPYFSYGIAERSRETTRGDQLIQRADEQMYLQKREHKGHNQNHSF
jgi:diguanylate cyclase (GGDEF)-like protein